jgi:hypothetical protein
MTGNPIFHAGTKHIEVDFYFPCELLVGKAAQL